MEIHSSFSPTLALDQGLPVKAVKVLAAGTGGRAVVFAVTLPDGRKFAVKIGPDRGHQELKHHQALTGHQSILPLVAFSSKIRSLKELFPSLPASEGKDPWQELRAEVNARADCGLINKKLGFTGVRADQAISVLVMQLMDGDMRSGPWKQESTPVRQAVVMKAKRAYAESQKHMGSKGLSDTDEALRNLLWRTTGSAPEDIEIVRSDLGKTWQKATTSPGQVSDSFLRTIEEKVGAPDREAKKAKKKLRLDESDRE